jgi:hypothetical protein
VHIHDLEGYGYTLESKISGVSLLHRRLIADRAAVYQAHTLEVGDTRVNSGRYGKKTVWYGWVLGSDKHLRGYSGIHLGPS